MRQVFSITLGVLSAVLGVLILFPAPQADASALQIRPLTYPENLADGPVKLEPGETKKGFIDISNASHSRVSLEFVVKGFKQVDGEGNLQFFDSEELRRGIQLDLKAIELGPQEALRLYFVADSSKLPPGDIFAGIFAKNVSKEGSGITHTAQVGTLLILQNGKGGSHNAVVEGLNVPLFQFSDTINGAVNVRNTASSDKVTGFFPQMTASLGPWINVNTEFKGPLVFAGITRNVPFTLPVKDKIGIYKLTVQVGNSSVDKWVFIATGYWRGVIVLLAISLLLLLGFLSAKYKRSRRVKGLRFAK